MKIVWYHKNKPDTITAGYNGIHIYLLLDSTLLDIVIRINMNFPI